MFAAYKKLAGTDIEESIKSETTGNLENLMVAIGEVNTLKGFFTDAEPAF